MEKDIELSIITINYNAKTLTDQAVQSIVECSPQISFEIIVVDNSSDYLEEYESGNANVTVIKGVENRGFGNACNIGVSHSQGKFILFLNNDTIMHKGTLEACLEYMRQHSDVGALGVRTLLKDGNLDHACKRGFPTPMSSLYYFLGVDKKYPQSKRYGAYRQTFLADDEVSEVDSVAGSFLMMTRSLFNQLGGFDEDFFMYGEDLDLCYRVKQKGFSVIYYGKATITHLKGQSGLYSKSREVVRHFYNAMLIFYKKNYKKKYPMPITALVYIGIKARYTTTIIKMKLGK
ncbi:MAG TPA: glycosyltransferase family 2 protein [Desulfitobacterium dehalogenans]|uniref:Glycosyltransferase family 2 protein n=1 Tax=Desulfitobacterium dehalogenans TaxID=36854 RepID=A0A7C6Z4N0_9FIRM|nr:glycosyltransferase family 2 protein [Desulfitobacterium dehalogenans]